MSNPGAASSDDGLLSWLDGGRSWLQAILSDNNQAEAPRAASPPRVSEAWLGAVESDAGLDAEEQAVVEQPAQKRRRGRGRPPGTGGSAAVRQAVREFEQQQVVDEEVVAPQAGSIEYARAARAAYVEQRRQQEARVAQVKAAACDVADSLECRMGSSVQRTLAKVWLATSAASVRGAAEPDRAVDTVLGHLPGAFSARAAAKLLSDVPGGVQDMLLQAGAAVFALGCWWWSMFLTYVGLVALAASPPYKLCLLVVKLKYDETPCKVRVGVGGRLLPRRAARGSAETTRHAKIMQSDHVQGFLLQSTQDLSFTWCSYSLPTRLCAVDRTTAENIRAVLYDHVVAVPDPFCF